MKRFLHITRNNSAAFSVSVLLAAAVFLAFGQTLRHEFVNYDDNLYFYSNPQVQAGLTWHGVMWAFRTGETNNWHPLTWLSLMLDVTLFGTAPAGPHLTNIILHAANTVLLFLLLRRLTGAHWRSAFVAALFALHPLHVESVAWVSERKDMLSACFGLLALLMYARYARAGAKPPASRDYWLALLLYALALMSKPMMVTLPFVMLLLDWWPLGRFEPTVARSRSSVLGRLMFEKLPLIALSAVSSMVTLVYQKKAIQSLTHITIGIRIVNAVVSYGRYLGKMFWPVNLAVPYPHTGYASFELCCLSAVLIAAVCLVVYRLRSNFPFLVTGWFWYLGMLVPVIGLVQVGMQSMADRYTYLPLVCVFIMLTWGADKILKRWELSATAICPMALLVLAACTARTIDQLRVWQDSETLFRHALAVTDDNFIAHNNLGLALMQTGRVEDAVPHFRQALSIRPAFAEAHNNLGNALLQTGSAGEALEHFREASRLMPDSASVHYDLGNALSQIGHYGEAIAQYELALRIKPDFAEARYNLGNALLRSGKAAEAIAQYEQALRIRPDHPETHCNLGNALLDLGRAAEARTHYEQALRIKPDFAEAHNNLGNALLQLGHVPEAIAQYQQALRIKPEYAEARDNLLRLRASP
jgi:protein O-mannosyl-transferase